MYIGLNAYEFIKNEQIVLDLTDSKIKGNTCDCCGPVKQYEVYRVMPVGSLSNSAIKKLIASAIAKL